MSWKQVEVKAVPTLQSIELLILVQIPAHQTTLVCLSWYTFTFPSRTDLATTEFHPHTCTHVVRLVIPVHRS